MKSTSLKKSRLVTKGIINPKAHENIVETDPISSLKYLYLSSLLIEIA